MPKKTDGPADQTFDGLSLLSCDTLGDLDNGFAREVIDEALKRAVTDVEQRGNDERVRKVVITLELKKLDTNAVAIFFAADAKLPPLRLDTAVAQTRPVGRGEHKLAFRADNGARPDQPTMFPKEKDGE